MSYTNGQIWLIIVVIGLGTFLLRFSFLGAIGQRSIPEPMMRMLRYTAVAVLPGLAAPLAIWPAEGGNPDPLRLAAALTTLVAGVLTRNTLMAIIAGGAVFGLGLYLT